MFAHIDVLCISTSSLDALLTCKEKSVQKNIVEKILSFKASNFINSLLEDLISSDNHNELIPLLFQKSLVSRIPDFVYIREGIRILKVIKDVKHATCIVSTLLAVFHEKINYLVFEFVEFSKLLYPLLVY